MRAEAFYAQMVALAARSPVERRLSLTRLHQDVAASYLHAVRAITAQEASRVSSDGRTLGQVVGHIAEWDRYTVLAIGEIIAGVRWPQIMRLSGYVEPDGQVREFANVHAFNAHQAAKHAACPWPQIQTLAIDVAQTLQALFADPSLLSTERLEQTRAYCWQLGQRMSLTVPCGWYLWMVTLEHAGVEHAADLGLADI